MVEGGMLQEVSASCTSIQPSDDEGCNQVADLPTTTSEVKEFTSAKTPHLSHKKRRGILSYVDVTREKNLTPKCKKLYNMATEWGRRTARVQHKVKNLQTRLANAEKIPTKGDIGFGNH
ncbi:hypothetical protein MTP99_006756 [Tenebrio molitor]|nr:hypothetical protein MTP99_006756 [Tenebrio molitor]